MDFLLNNIFYVALAVASGGMLLWPLLQRSGGCPAISTLDATVRINKQDAMVLDVRDAAQYAQGHLPRARNIPVKELEARLSEIERYRNKPVIVTCDTGVRAGGAAAILKKAGFAEVVTLDGGLAAWRKADLPVER